LTARGRELYSRNPSWNNDFFPNTLFMAGM
jgi:hypothetical protein